MQIMLAEAKSKWCAEVKRALVSEGHVVKVTSSGRKAIAAIKENDFDLVVVGSVLKHVRPERVFAEVLKWAENPQRSVPHLLFPDDLPNKSTGESTSVRCYFLPMRTAAEVHAIINDILYSNQRQQARISVHRMAKLAFEDVSVEGTVNDISLSGLSIVVPRRRFSRVPATESHCSMVVFVDSWTSTIGKLGVSGGSSQAFWMDGLMDAEGSHFPQEKPDELEMLKVAGVIKRVVLYKRFLRSQVLLGVAFDELNDEQRSQVKGLISAASS